MKNIVGVNFDFNSKKKSIEYFFVEKKIRKNIYVITENEKGQRYGKVVTDVHIIDDKKLNTTLGKVIRIATKEDYIQYCKNLKVQEKALLKCKNLVSKEKLDMKVIDSEYLFDRSKLIFYFVSDKRIDFRLLAKKLASCYKTRIELRQIGVRDNAKIIGGIGCCGQKICCSRFLKKFDSVSISMAKNQNLALSPSKINGLCGRLLCCLNYEDKMYCDLKKDKLKIGTYIELDEGKAKIVSVDVISKKYTLEFNNGTRKEVKFGGED